VLPVAVMVGAGWLFLFGVLLIVPPSPRPHEGGGRGEAGRRVNLRHREDVTVAPVEPPPVAHSLEGLILINIDDRLIRSSIWNHAIDSFS